MKKINLNPVIMNIKNKAQAMPEYVMISALIFLSVASMVKYFWFALNMAYGYAISFMVGKY